MGAVSDGMSGERLAVVRATVTAPSKYALEHDAKDMACELLAEVDRLREVERHLRATIADEHSRLSQEFENEERQA